MISFPKSTEFNKRIPKEKFYENLNVTPAIKKHFINQIMSIYWRNKIASTTTNLAQGTIVSEIEVFEIRLKINVLDEIVLRQIDKEIPYHIIFLLKYENKYQAWTAYKQASNSSYIAFKVNQYYHTDWMNEDELSLRIDGLNMDSVYENFVYQIAGDVLQANEEESLQDAVERNEKIKNLKKQIEVLKAKIRKEKQLNIQIKLNSELKRLKKELEVL